MKKIGVPVTYTESILVQLVFYLVLWIISEYVASLLTVIIIPIVLAILIISIVVDLIEPAGISKSYFVHLILLAVVPFLIGVVFFSLTDGNFDWLDDGL